MICYLEENHLLADNQHGFRAWRSGLTNLIHCLDSWTKSLDEGTQVDVIYFDFENAFDSVPHRRLLYKLSMYGFTGRLLKWIQQFLTYRSRSVSINATHSEYAPVRSGVPQGSVLGAPLFLIIIDDLHLDIQSQNIMFADDVKMWRPINTVFDRTIVQDGINKLQQWSDRWLLKFNTSKCV